MIKLLKNKEIRITVFIFILLSLMYSLLFEKIGSMNDFRYHILFAIDMLQGNLPLAGNFFLYSLMILGSFFSTNYKTVAVVLSILLAAATSYRYYFSFKQFQSVKLFESNDQKNFCISVILAVSLLFVFSIPVYSLIERGHFYIGNFTPNVWHNSTTIFLFPFSILLFYYSNLQVLDYKPKRDLIILILTLLNIFIKPSFFLVFIVVYPLMMLFKYRFSIVFFKSMLPLFIGALSLLLQTWLIYNPDNPSGSSITICFFCTYKTFTTLIELPFSILFSMLFPIIYSILNFKKLRKTNTFFYIIFLVIVSILIYLVLAETGPRFKHANFYWQTVVTAWIFFIYTLKYLLEDIKNNGFYLKNKILIIIYMFHVVVGLLYLLRILLTASAA